MFRSIPSSTVFYPSDAVSTERACELAANTPGLCFIRTSRPGTAVVYDNDHQFEVSDMQDFSWLDLMQTQQALRILRNDFYTLSLKFAFVFISQTIGLLTNNFFFNSCQIGKGNVIKSSGSDKVLVIGAAITLREAMTAADQLASEGINLRVMDLFTIKPIDKDGIIKNARECGGRIIVVEDHYAEGREVFYFIKFFSIAIISGTNVLEFIYA